MIDVILDDEFSIMDYFLTAEDICSLIDRTTKKSRGVIPTPLKSTIFGHAFDKVTYSRVNSMEQYVRVGSRQNMINPALRTDKTDSPIHLLVVPINRRWITYIVNYETRKFHNLSRRVGAILESVSVQRRHYDRNWDERMGPDYTWAARGEFVNKHEMNIRVDKDGNLPNNIRSQSITLLHTYNGVVPCDLVLRFSNFAQETADKPDWKSVHFNMRLPGGEKHVPLYGHNFWNRHAPGIKIDLTNPDCPVNSMDLMTIRILQETAGTRVLKRTQSLGRTVV